MQDWFPTRAVTGSHCRTHRPRNAVSKTALQFVLPASDKTQSLSSPSFGKARLPEKAALWVGTGPAAPHGTWERTSRRLRRKPDRETEKIKRVSGRLAAKGCLLQARSEALRRTGLRSSWEKRRCGLRLPNNPVQSLAGRFFKYW